MMTQGGPVTASMTDTARTVASVLVPLVARGPVVRRRRVSAVGERVDADRRLVRTLQALRARYGSAPLPLRLPLRRIVLVLDHADVHHVLANSPEPYATATREKRAALARFGPHGVLISDAAERPDRRRFNEAVLDTGRPLHHLAKPMAAVARHEALTLRTQVTSAGGDLEWPAFAAAWYRAVRRVTLGDGARDDTELTDLLARLRAQGNWANLAPPRPALTRTFLDGVRTHLDRAEADSLAAVVADTPAGPGTATVEQVPQWLFAFDAAGMTAFRALALLATHPRELAAVRAEIASGPGVPTELPHLRAAVLEAVRLWPTTPAILRETTAATELNGVPLEPGTLVLICSAFFHRDNERHSWADDFAPRLWTGDVPRAALVPFSGGPAVCAGQDLVLFLTSTFLSALLDGQDVRVAGRSVIRPGRPLPGTLDPFQLRFTLGPRHPRAESRGAGR
jgi:cytochrome P450